MTRSEAQGESLRPLRDDPSVSDPDLALGARLLHQVGAAPRSEQRRRRVWNALSAGAAPKLGLRLRSFHLAFAAVLCAAASSATVGYLASRDASEAAPSPAPAAATPEREKPGVPMAPAPAARTDEVSQAPAPRAAAAEVPPARSKPDGGNHTRAAQSEAEAQLLVEAMRARRAGDAERVSELVDEYRAKHPQGTLQEEALILSVESAASRRAPNTAALAREYLARFPNGRFVEQARRALNPPPR